MSSPNRKTLGSAAISSRSAAFRASAYRITAMSVYPGISGARGIDSECRERVGKRQPESLLDGLRRLLVDLDEPLFADLALQRVERNADRVTRLPCGDLFGGLIPAHVGGRKSFDAVGLGLDHAGAFAGAGAVDHRGHGAVDGDRVVSVDDDRRDVVALGPNGNVLDRRLYRGRH